jgi:methionine aminopeptidase
MDAYRISRTGGVGSAVRRSPGGPTRKEILMKKTFLKLALACGLLATALLPVSPVSAQKCATCPELLKACKTFCGSNNVVFNCQNSNPCAGTCTCG